MIIDQTHFLFKDIVNTIREPLLVLDSGLKVLLANQSFMNSFKVTQEATIGAFIYDLGNGQWDIPKLRELLETILPEKTTFNGYEVEHDFATIGRRTMLLNARQIEREMGKERIILLAIEDITERREIEAGLEKTRKELAVIKIAADEVSEYAESIINTVREPLIALDQDLRVVSASRSFYDFFKVKPEETMGRLIYDLGNGQWDIPKLRELLENILPEKTTFDGYEVEHDFATIGRRIMLLNARQIERRMGEERIILLAIEDITERKRLETLLVDSEVRYRRLFETANDGILLLEKSDLKICHANPAITSIFGYSNADCIGKEMKDIGFTFERGTSQELLQRLDKDGIIHFDDIPVKTNDGYTIDTDIYMVDKTSLIQCNIRDITERKKAEADRNQMLAAIMQAGESIVITTLDGTIQYVNPAFEHMTGYSKQESVGRNPRFLKSGLQDKPFYKNLWDTIISGNHWSGSLINKRKDGTSYVSKCSISPVKDPKNNLINFIWIAKDITKEVALEKRIAQAQKMESIGILAGGIAHDFNNILSAIIGFTELALDEVEKDTALEDDLKEIQVGGIRAKDLVKQILSFARESDEIINPLRIDIIAKEVLRFIRASIPSTIELEADIQSDSLIMGNPTQIHQIFMNLCTNSAHAMKENGGVLSVSINDVETDKNPDVKNIGLEEGNYIKIKISDTGTGIPPAIIDKIFEPYFTTKTVEDGTGMGLAMIQGIVENYSGKIMVNSIMEKGTIFTLYLPITQKPETYQPYEVKKLSSGSERILIVDDEAPILKIESRILKRFGYTVTTSISSVEALELFRSHPNDFDLVITDMTMPKITGEKLAAGLIEIRPDIPIILCTGYSQKLSDKNIGAKGIREVISKPIAIDNLLKSVRKVLDEC
jgi:PAS domain S-box-containing protein